MSSLPVAVVGAGPAGLAAAERLAAAGRRVTLFDRMPAPARKFLLAGRGGLNLSKDEPPERFMAAFRPQPVPPPLAAALAAFPLSALRAWAEGLGQELFVGSSGRLFPVAMKASPLLRAWLARLAGQGVELRLRTAWTGHDGDALTFADGTRHEGPAILALGGASWPRLGSDGSWVPLLRSAGVTVTDLVPANAAVRISWSDHLHTRFAGTPLKRIALSCGGRTIRGEAVLSAEGLEGGAVYALGPELRAGAPLRLDLRPDLSRAELAARLARPRGSESLSNFLRKQGGLAPVAVALLREAGPPPDSPAGLADRIKSVTLPTLGLAGLARAISTAGGVAWESVDARLRLRPWPNVAVCGEMLDWEAPTGGYLLHACLATGRAAAEGLLETG